MAKAKAKTRSADATSGANAAGVESYLTPAADEVSTAEFIDRKSRFIAHLTHVESEDEASAFIESIRRQHYDARHNVPARVMTGSPSARAACLRSRSFAGRASGIAAAW